MLSNSAKICRHNILTDFPNQVGNLQFQVGNLISSPAQYLHSDQNTINPLDNFLFNCESYLHTHQIQVLQKSCCQHNIISQIIMSSPLCGEVFSLRPPSLSLSLLTSFSLSLDLSSFKTSKTFSSFLPAYPNYIVFQSVTRAARIYDEIFLSITVS